METNSNSPKDGRNKQGRENDAREKANTGDWDDFRRDATPKQDDYNPDTNDNTGGAGSTGSAATNS